MVEKRRHRVWRYWDIDPDHRTEYRTEDEYVEHFLEIFEEAVRSRLRSMKPVGIQLSGGMDSGSVASIAGQLLQRDNGVSPPAFRAYSHAYEELAQCDERHISDRIADYYGFSVTDVWADEAWPLKDYPAHGPDRDEPYIGPYQVLEEKTMAVARSEGMGLVIGGDRGDQIVGDGVVDHLGLLRAGELGTLWAQLRAQGRRSSATLPRLALTWLLKPLLFEIWPQGTEWALDKYHKLQGDEVLPPYPDWVRPEFAERVNLAEIVRQNEKPRSDVRNLARRMRYESVFAFGAVRGMVWTERNEARFGLGFADAWSDRRLASFVLSIPQWRIQRVGEPKRVARQAMRSIMPEQVRQKAGKIAHPAPLYYRALREQAKTTILDLITDSRAAALGYVDEDKLCRHYQSILGGVPDYRLYFWWTLTLEWWLRQHWD